VARSGSKPWLVLLAVPALLVVAAIAFLAWRQSVPRVRAEVAPVPRFIGIKTPLTVQLAATRGGVASAEIRLVQGQGHVVVASPSFPGGGNDQRLELTVDGKALGLREGAATLEVRARDGFWRPLRGDDRAVLSAPVTLDFTPPVVEVLAHTQYLAQGGGGLVAFRVKGGAARVGVNVGGLFLPAYAVGPPESGVLTALIALPWDFPTTSAVTVVAQDEAGNAASRPVPAEIKPRRFPAGSVDLKEEFLARKLPELLPDRAAVAPAQYAQAFLIVNRDQRRVAEQTKHQLATRTQPKPLWEGAFVQPRNTQVFSNFAETRAYKYGGKDIDTQVHMGYDLASLKQSPVPAANSGTVVFAGPLTIYGNAVVLDHGLGLQTLYAHLSSLAVKDGDAVKKGQELGRTGSTGLAVGDHLHYEVLIHGISVTPLEWWDGKWIRDHIGKPLREASLPMLQSDQPAADAPAASAPAAPRPRRRAR
jgi:murein DD-endopeptidase MepM/ murein hydrolase activator NlpD